MSAAPRTLLSLLSQTAEQRGDAPLYRFLVEGDVDGPEEVLSARSLDRWAWKAQVGHDYIGPFQFEYLYPFRRVRRHQYLMSEIFQYLDKGLPYALFIFYNQDLRHSLPP